MLDSSRLRSEFDSAVERFVDAIVELIRERHPAPSAQPAAEESLPVGELGEKLLELVAAQPDGATADYLAKQAGIGLAPLFEELRNLVAAGKLQRVVRGETQLPVYVVPSEQDCSEEEE